MDTPTVPTAEKMPPAWRRFVLHAFAILLVGFGINAAIGDISNQADYIDIQRKKLSKQPHDVVIVGNSLAIEHLNAASMSQHSQFGAVDVHYGGTKSCWWYLGMKNVALELNPKPKMIVIPFSPDFVAHFRKDLLEYTKHDGALAHEPEVDKIIKSGAIGPSMTLLSAAPIGIMHNNEQIKRVLYEKVRNYILGHLSVQIQKGSEMMKNTLKAIDKKRLPPSPVPAEEKAALTIEKSCIPLIVNTAQDAKTKLVFVRVKTRDMQINEFDESFTEEIQRYFNERGVGYLDYSKDERIGAQDFSDERHLSKQSQQTFNAIVGNDLFPFLQ